MVIWLILFSLCITDEDWHDKFIAVILEDRTRSPLFAAWLSSHVSPCAAAAFTLNLTAFGPDFVPCWKRYRTFSGSGLFFLYSDKDVVLTVTYFQVLYFRYVQQITVKQLVVINILFSGAFQQCSYNMYRTRIIQEHNWLKFLFFFFIKMIRVLIQTWLAIRFVYRGTLLRMGLDVKWHKALINVSKDKKL